MSSARDQALDSIEAAVDFGNIASTELSDANEIRATVRGASESDGAGAEELEDQEVVSASGIAARPVDDDDGNVEALIFRRADEIVVVAFRDRRMQVSIAKGEVVVSNLNPDSPCRIRMRENGEVRIEAGRVDHCAPGETTASKALALAELVEGQFSRLKTAIGSATPVANDGGAALQTAIMTSLNTPPVFPESTASARVFTKD